ncbi:phenylalanine--tRNA ligase subunit beta [Spiractinospora alimapuensis]|uniref:phenylalanine--tRNA ligase subunit beta n=1 Tax=Spiractinospora alimapuensis TaxID=2820884 RepID=UPI001EEA6AF7|nr:phenylalanine--tRNA ligase subunit beta [Spiractinospora alimapuensis]QVQ52073.1 phenylalanine--tRNA ligase subunit beta [Spiractinospora alimapuensis]
MRVPVSWLRDYVDIPESTTGRDLAAALTLAGLEVETVEDTAAGIDGSLVVGTVLAIEELTGFKKPIRYCQVDVGDANGTGEPQNVICGAVNFAVGDNVIVVLPGSTLPGGFAVGARKTYGRMSEGMICSAKELGMWEEHAGILVLGDAAPAPGTDAVRYLELDDEVLDIAVTPDRGYALSLRGVAREVAVLYGLDFRDPAELVVDASEEDSYPAEVEAPEACSHYVLRAVRDFDPDAESPLWMKHRLAKGGVRPISLAVDVTNYVMLELGQPLHAWDRRALKGPLRVRLGHAGETLETLDHVTRSLDTDDILICDDTGPVNIAGVMGGLTTEIGPTSTDVVIEAAHFEAAHIGRTSRRHKLSSESSRRFERGVDNAVQEVAATRAVRLLADLGGAVLEPGMTVVDNTSPPATISVAESHAAAVSGVDYAPGTSQRRLRQIGCTVEELGEELRVTPPSWRPDLTDVNDFAEEVVRLEGYDLIPSVPPRAPAGRGLTPSQRLRRGVGRTLAESGLVEVLNYPFIGERDFDALQLPATDERRRANRLANPLSEDEPLLRTTLLPGLFTTVTRNVGRGFPDVALFELGLVYRPRAGQPSVAPVLPVDRGPSAAELESIAAALPDQPRMVGAVLTGDLQPAGWWGEGRPAIWADAIAVARQVARIANVDLRAVAASYEPWHPGRCAALYATLPDGAEVLVGHAGELHPRTVSAFGLPERTVAMELNLDLVERARQTVSPPRVSSFPVATQDIALVVDAGTPAGDVARTLREGAGNLLEDLRLFDVFSGEQVGEGKKSLAYTLRFRAADRTLTGEEVAVARDAAVAAATERFGAALRS